MTEAANGEVMTRNEAIEEFMFKLRGPIESGLAELEFVAGLPGGIAIYFEEIKCYGKPCEVSGCPAWTYLTKFVLQSDSTMDVGIDVRPSTAVLYLNDTTIQTKVAVPNSVRKFIIDFDHSCGPARRKL